MKTQNKKYILKESELKEIIKEMILMEVSQNQADAINGYTLGRQQQMRNGGGDGVQIKDYFNSLRGLMHGAGRFVNGQIPDKWKSAIESGNSDALKALAAWLGISTSDTAVGPNSVVPWVSDLKIAGGNGPGKGSNPDAHEVFYVDNAVRYIINNATPHYDPNKNGWCARHVRQALNYGGLGAPWGMSAPGGSSYISILPANGWYKIELSEVGGLKGTNGQKGDIVVLAPYTTPETGRYHKNGHIAMCCGNGLWVSDFKQQDMCGMKGTVPINVVNVFRYKNIQ